MKREIRSENAPAAIGPYSQGVAAGGFVFVSGQIPLGPDGKLAEGGIKEQAERCIVNLAAILESSGSGLGDVVKTTVYMRDLAQFPEMNEVYARHFKAPCPARATVEVSALPKGALVEIDAIAVRSR